MDRNFGQTHPQTPCLNQNYCLMPPTLYQRHPNQSATPITLGSPLDPPLYLDAPQAPLWAHHQSSTPLPLGCQGDPQLCEPHQILMTLDCGAAKEHPTSIGGDVCP